MRQIIFPLLLGIAGCAVLVWLGMWQVQRLAWKEGILAEIDARMAQAPAAFSSDMTEAADEYRTVRLSGARIADELHVLTSGTAAGTGYRVISKVVLSDGSSVLVDHGLLPLDAKGAPPTVGPIDIVGTLLWPDDRNNSTPDPDLPKNIWFARDVAQMAEHLDADPFMVVASQVTPPDPRLTLLPVTSTNIKNDHLEYAITWFLLAAVWAIMSLYLIVRTRKET